MLFTEIHIHNLQFPNKTNDLPKHLLSEINYYVICIMYTIL